MTNSQRGLRRVSDDPVFSEDARHVDFEISRGIHGEPPSRLVSVEAIARNALTRIDRWALLDQIMCNLETAC
jgi:hypothetical protein